MRTTLGGFCFSVDSLLALRYIGLTANRLCVVRKGFTAGWPGSPAWLATSHFLMIEADSRLFFCQAPRIHVSVTLSECGKTQTDIPSAVKSNLSFKILFQRSGFPFASSHLRYYLRHL